MENITTLKNELEKAKKLQAENLEDLRKAKEGYKKNPTSVSPDYELSVIQFKEYARVDKFLVKEARLALRVAELTTNYTQGGASPA